MRACLWMEYEWEKHKADPRAAAHAYDCKVVRFFGAAADIYEIRRLVC